MTYGNCRTTTAAYSVIPNELVRHELKVLGVDDIGDELDGVFTSSEIITNK